MQHLQPNTLLQGGQYKITRYLAKGGFGITYLAYSSQLKTNVAIKEYINKDWHQRLDNLNVVTKKEYAEIAEKFKKKFAKEAHTIQKLHHPNIVKVYDLFEENGTLYYAMEYIKGCSLDQYVRQEGSLKEDEAKTIIYDVAKTLEFIHDNNQLHLDITPRNIMITEDYGIKLIDFGVSKHYSKDGDQSTTTPVAHSKGYAPKEQYVREGLITFSPATDIYALSATLYFMLTGSQPPDANDRQQVLEEGKELLVIDSSWSKNLRKTITEGMQVSRKKRLQSVKQFLQTLKYTPAVVQPVADDEETEVTTPTSNTEDAVQKTSVADRTMNGCIYGVSIWFAACLILLGRCAYQNRVADSIFDSNKYEYVGTSPRGNLYNAYFKVYNPDTKQWGAVKKQCLEKNSKSHPDTDPENIVLPIEYDSLYVDEETITEGNDWLNSNTYYTFYGFKNGKLYDNSGKEFMIKEDSLTTNVRLVPVK